MRAVRVQRKALLAVGVPLVIALSLSPVAQAQDGESCRAASRGDAAEICRTYVLSLQQAGDQTEALAALEQALDWHPGDEELLDLKNRLGAKVSEDEQLDEAQRRDANAERRGQLKLTCLTKSGGTGADACRDYLNMTDDDGARIRARLAQLSPPPEPIPEPPTPDVAERPAPVPEPEPPVIVEIPTPAPTPLPEADPEGDRRRALIASIQSTLNELGLSAGIADGISGQRTREALATFFARNGEQPREAFDELTLEMLREAQPRLASARRMLGDSRAAERDGRPQDALALLEQASGESALFDEPPGYRAGLEARVASIEAERRTSEQAKNDTETPESVPTVDESATDLPERIGQLARALEEQRGVQQREMQQLRVAVTAALAR